MKSRKEQINLLKASIAYLDSQRAGLGDEVIDRCLRPLQQRLDSLRSKEQRPGSSFAGERKQVTILFADISGFTALSETLDPEEVRDLMNRCFQRLVPVIEDFQGTIDKFIGDEIMALFGAPIAQENAPETALRAALGMMRALEDFNREEGADLGMHMGINTGKVIAGVVGSNLRQDYSVMGDAVNLAARLEGASARGEIFVGPTTYRLTHGLFEFEKREPIPLKGKKKPVQVYRLIGTRSERFSMRGIQGLSSRLVGRSQEIQTLLEPTEQLLKSGPGCVLAITGEAGMGKSRIIREMRKSLDSRFEKVQGQAFPHTTRNAYWLIRDLFRSWLSRKGSRPLSEGAEALRSSVSKHCAESADDTFTYLARLLDLPVSEERAEKYRYLDPRALQEQMAHALQVYLCGVAAEKPLLLVWEDLQWADPSSLLLLEKLLPLSRQNSILHLLTFRPDRANPIWTLHHQNQDGNDTDYRSIELKPLNREQSLEMVSGLLKSGSLPTETIDLILEKSEGNPFVLEEVLRSLLESGAIQLENGEVVNVRAIDSIDLPDTLEGLIAARIDSLSSREKQVLRIASVLGRSFRTKFLRWLTPPGLRRTMQSNLVELEERDLIFPENGDSTKTAHPSQSYRFKYDLIFQTAYKSLLRSRRQALHQQIADWVEKETPLEAGDQIPTLAYHFERASLPRRALPYTVLAADTSRAKYANREAISYYRTALNLLEKLVGTKEPETRLSAEVNEKLGEVLELNGSYERARNAFGRSFKLLPRGAPVAKARLLRKTGTSWRLDHRYEEALNTYAEADKLLGKPSESNPSEWWNEWISLQLERSFCLYFLNRPKEALSVLKDAQPRVERFGAPEQRHEFFSRMAAVELRRQRYGGNLDRAQGFARTSMEAGEHSENPRIRAESHFIFGFVCWFQRSLEEAEHHLSLSLDTIKRTGDIWLQLIYLTYRTTIYRQRNELEMTRKSAQQALDIGERTGRAEYIGTAYANLSWLAWRDKNYALALDQAEQALQAWRSLPPDFKYPLHWTAIFPKIACLLECGRSSEAVHAVDGLLEPSQQLLPEPLARQLALALEARAAGQKQSAIKHLENALSTARRGNFL